MKWVTIFANVATYMDGRRALEISIKEIVQNKLREGELIAFGHKANQKNAYAIQRIAGHFWRDAAIDWKNDSASNPTEEFSRIAVVHANDHPKLNANGKIGRPTNKALIFSAISAAVENGSEFWDLSNKEKIRIIRGWISIHHPALDPYGSGMGDDAIRKHISEFQKRR